jgi:hypothetical protein
MVRERDGREAGRMGDAPGRSALAAGQLLAVYALGAVGVPVVLGIGLLLLFVGTEAAALAAAVGVPVVFLVVLWLIVKATADASVLGATSGGRALWALLVLGFGAALWMFGWALTDAVGLGVSDNRGLVAMCSGLPFVLVAGVLLRGWPARLTAAGSLVALLAAGLVALAGSEPPPVPDAQTEADRAGLYVVAVPGYRPTEPTFGETVGTRTFVPTDPARIPPQRWITVLAYAREYASTEPGPCGETARDSHLQSAECTGEPDGRVYRRGVVQHGYQVTAGPLLVVVAGPHAVDRDALRAAAATVRRPTPAELTALSMPGADIYTAAVPGYVARAYGNPPGVQLTPSDPAASPQSVLIDVFTDFAERPCGAAACTPDADGLSARRTDEMHGFVIRRGDLNVYAMGGVSVPDALLRRAALDARPVTDEEYRRSRPPPVPAPPGPLDRLRRWLRG